MIFRYHKKFSYPLGNYSRQQNIVGHGLSINQFPPSRKKGEKNTIGHMSQTNLSRFIEKKIDGNQKFHRRLDFISNTLI